MACVTPCFQALVSSFRISAEIPNFLGSWPLVSPSNAMLVLLYFRICVDYAAELKTHPLL